MCDCILLTKVHNVHELQGLLQFCQSTPGPTGLSKRREGDPLMPLCSIWAFTIRVRDSVQEERLRPDRTQAEVFAGSVVHIGNRAEYGHQIWMNLWKNLWDFEGIKIVGTPTNSEDLEPDLQCAWQIVLQCAGFRCHYPEAIIGAQSATTSESCKHWTICWVV